MNKLTILKAIITSFSLLVFSGGVMGYIKAGSVASIVMSTLFALGYVMALLAARYNEKSGFIISLCLSVVLLLFFSYRFMATGSWVPAGMMALLSSAVVMSHSFFTFPKVSKQQEREG